MIVAVGDEHTSTVRDIVLVDNAEVGKAVAMTTNQSRDPQINVWHV